MNPLKKLLKEELDILEKLSKQAALNEVLKKCEEMKKHPTPKEYSELNKIDNTLANVQGGFDSGYNFALDSISSYIKEALK